ncbi:MAG: cysteine-rich CWC family protein [Proteobacteria bacterium]|nr:cysteine-rich CWC family protein [Pseudomonadota bacterium]
MNAAPAAIIDATRCPLCGADNRCAIEMERATGQVQAPCWCMDKPLLDTAAAQALHDRLPASARGLACICATCMVQLLQETREHSP